MIGYNNSAPKAVNNVGQFGATEGTIGAYKSAAEYAADAKYWALLSQTKYSSVDEILAEIERLYAQGLLIEEDIKNLKTDFETQQRELLGLIQSTGAAIDNTNAATELSKDATQKVLAQLDIISNMTVQTTLLPPGSLATGSYDNSTGVFDFGIPEGQPGRDGTDGTISDIGDVPVGTPGSDDYGFYVDKEDGSLYRASMTTIADLVPSVRSISINGGEGQTGDVSFNSVSSFNSRTGDVVAQTGDYEVSQITGAASNGVNSDITELAGLTTAITIGQGGTGSTTASGARDSLGLGSVSTESVVPISKGGTGVTSQSSLWTVIRPSGATPLSSDPVSEGDAATKRYVDNSASLTTSNIKSELLLPTGASMVNTEGDITVQEALNSITSVNAQQSSDIAAQSIKVDEALSKYSITSGSVKYSRGDFAERTLSLLDFGNPTSDAGDSINIALNHLTTVGDAFAHGGVVRIPAGFNTVQTPVNLNRYTGTDLSDNVTLKGEGAGTSELRAGSTITDGNLPIVRVGTPGGFGIQQYHLDSFSTRGGWNGVRVETASRGNISRVKVENSISDGIYIGNSWVNVFTGILVNNAGANGVNFNPSTTTQKTSTSVNSGYVNRAAGACWVWGHMNYSVATAVAADNAGSYGHHIKRSEGFMMNGCGNESSQRSGIFAEASQAIGANRSVTINNYFSHDSSLSDEGWANLLHVRSTDNTDNKIRINDSTSHAPAGTLADIVVDGVGAVAIVDNCVLPKGIKTYNGGYIDWVHHPLLINSKSVAASTATVICNLGSTQGHTSNVDGENSSFAGEVTIVASTSAPHVATRRIAVYKLLVCTDATVGKQAILMSSAGFTSGSVAGSPSFTWSINTSNQLVATPIGSSAGVFWFEITTDSQVKASA